MGNNIRTRSIAREALSFRPLNMGRLFRGRSLRAIVEAGSLSLLSMMAYNCSNNDNPVVPPENIYEKNILQLPDSGRLYPAVFLANPAQDDSITADVIRDFRVKTGVSPLLIKRFWSITANSGRFPMDEALTAKAEGAMLFISDFPLKKWGDLSTVILPDLTQQLNARTGEYYESYQRFFRTMDSSALDYVFVTAHEYGDPNSSYPWSINNVSPAQYAGYLEAVYGLMKSMKVKNVTYLINLNAGYQALGDIMPFLKPSHFDGILYNSFQSRAFSSWAAGEALFGKDLDQATKLGFRYIGIGETSRNKYDITSDDSSVTLASSVQTLLARKGFMHTIFDHDKTDGGWGLDPAYPINDPSKSNLADYQRGMKNVSAGNLRFVRKVIRD